MWVLIDRKLFQRNRMHGEPFRCIYVTERCYQWFRLGIDARPGDKPLHEPLITYCQLHQHGHTSVQYQMINKVNLISQQGVFENVVYKMAAILFFIIAVVSMQRDTNVHICESKTGTLCVEWSCQSAYYLLTTIAISPSAPVLLLFSWVLYPF